MEDFSDYENENFEEDYYGSYEQGYPHSDGWSDEEEGAGVSLSELYSLCLLPSVSEGIVHVAYLLLWCFIFRITTQTVKLPVVASHAISAASGLLVLNFFFGSTAHYVLVLGIIFYLILFFTSFSLNKWIGVVTSVSCIVISILCEFLLVKKTEWHKIRGAHMIVVMKVISLAFDMEMGTQRTLPSPVEFAGYIFSVGTCIFGPWVPFRDYLAVYKKPVFNLQWLWRILLSLAMAFLFLTVSMCWISWLIPDDAWRWWTAYRDAVSFRSSHYFVSFVSEASALMSGYGLQEDLTWSVPVSRPHHIEIPRSLVQVVVYWSMPMHTFLKQYVFRTTRPFGSFVAIICTYAVSSLLHGINFQLAAVLLSLGVYTYVEFMLRQKLASVFNACILSKPCRANCPHTHKETKLIVLLANIGFGILAFFHLIYLGVMFDSTEIQEEGYSYKHTLAKWAHLSYASHWVAGFTFLFHLLI
ncbi:Hypothetical predicted protein [Cloeon dipterum]|uniref:Protein-serine O-palmitoleoyltransferase porcupine n=1 Tax=Cloeon dipterum TaxID=197152 RepID=A0A8S1CMU6_9INSE|nr:Hypothetical predicted protein [Cloeon dipterum]